VLQQLNALNTPARSVSLRRVVDLIHFCHSATCSHLKSCGIQWFSDVMKMKELGRVTEVGVWLIRTCRNQRVKVRSVSQPAHQLTCYVAHLE
jgi:hypothetical protein